ncbi:MAG: GNAT family N-acetyltransferase [Deltaproteobacteria bacterium]|nr:GNAT family N-acetyltransferase [Deltaproteobacteria bacterium]
MIDRMDGSKKGGTYCDRTGISFDIVECREEYFPPLMDMYETFYPRPASQGLPPVNEETCLLWVKTLIGQGLNVLALREGRVIGHAALSPESKRNEAEFVIFVHQDVRSKGIGSLITESIIRRAREAGLAALWLSVDMRNVRAVRLYRKHGFAYCDDDPSERVMRLPL